MTYSIVMSGEISDRQVMGIYTTQEVAEQAGRLIARYFLTYEDETGKTCEVDLDRFEIDGSGSLTYEGQLILEIIPFSTIPELEMARRTGTGIWANTIPTDEILADQVG